MSYQAHVTDVAYCYDGSFAGFLCCVFESYARREIPAEVCPPEEGQLNFFGARDIPTDPQRARRVAAGLERLGAQVKDCITTGFLSTEGGKDLTLLRFARRRSWETPMRLRPLPLRGRSAMRPANVLNLSGLNSGTICWARSSTRSIRCCRCCGGISAAACPMTIF